LVGLVREYLDIASDTGILSAQAREAADGYINFIARKASGELPTTATWIRNFVRSHPTYRHDSVVSPRINYDLMQIAADIGSGKPGPADLVGSISRK